MFLGVYECFWVLEGVESVIGCFWVLVVFLGVSGCL